MFSDKEWINEITTALAFMLMPGTGNRGVRKIIDLASALDCPLSELTAMSRRELYEAVPIGSETVARSMASCTQSLMCQARLAVERVYGSGATALLISQPDYPQHLKDSLGPRAPALLFVKGDVSLLAAHGVGVVGTRTVSCAGARVARQCSRHFAHRSILISGGAKGVDSIAHEAALEAGGSTVVVIPQGLMTYTQPHYISKAIAKGQAAVLSEFPPAWQWQAHAAVTRNATISGLSRLLCAIEPGEKSGSMGTALHGLNQGKSVGVFWADGMEDCVPYLAQAGGVSLELNDAGLVSCVLLDKLWDMAQARRGVQASLF